MFVPSKAAARTSMPGLLYDVTTPNEDTFEMLLLLTELWFPVHMFTPSNAIPKT